VKKSSTVTCKKELRKQQQFGEGGALFVLPPALGLLRWRSDTDVACGKWLD